MKQANSSIPIEGQYLYDAFSNSWSIGDVVSETQGPLTACIQLTRRCNMRCKYCFEPYDDDMDMEIQQLEQIISSLASSGTRLVRLTGGEPLLYRHIDKAVSLVNDYGMSVAIDTNASLLSKDAIGQLKKNVTFFAVSLDGDRFVHNKYRGKYLSVRNAVKLLRDDGIPVLISTVLTDQSINDIFELLKFAEEVGVLSLRIVPMLKRGKGQKVLNDKRILVNNDFVSELRKYKRQQGISLKVVIIDWTRVSPGSVIMIKKNGDMIGMPGADNIAGEVFIGNVLNSTVSEVWNVYSYKNNHIKKCLEKSVFSI